MSLVLLCRNVEFGRQWSHGLSLTCVWKYGSGKSESLLKVEVRLKNPGRETVAKIIRLKLFLKWKQICLGLSKIKILSLILHSSFPIYPQYTICARLRGVPVKACTYEEHSGSGPGRFFTKPSLLLFCAILKHHQDISFGVMTVFYD